MMITLKQLKEILDSVERTTQDPTTQIRIDIDHGSMSYEDDSYVNTASTIQSVKIEKSMLIDPSDPKAQIAPFVCVITVEE